MPLPRLKSHRCAAWDCNLQALKTRQSKLDVGGQDGAGADQVEGLGEVDQWAAVVDFQVSHPARGVVSVIVGGVVVAGGGHPSSARGNLPLPRPSTGTGPTYPTEFL
jgi:hypothetical protein